MGKESAKAKTQAGSADPLYKFEIGECYDVSDQHKSVWSAEYTGYEIIGRLILYCFMQDTQPYKFSEVALVRGGSTRKNKKLRRTPRILSWLYERGCPEHTGYTGRRCGKMPAFLFCPRRTADFSAIHVLFLYLTCPDVSIFPLESNISYQKKEEKAMAKRCPEDGKIKLYLDCMECEGKNQCRGKAKSSNKDKNSNRKDISKRG